MQYWFSPSSIHSSLEEKLEAAGMKPLSQATVEIDSKEVLLIYSAPDQILEKSRIDESTAISSEDVLTTCKEMEIWSKKCKKTSSSWRLNLLDNTLISRLCNGEDPRLDKGIDFPRVMPLAGLLTLEIIKQKSKIIDIYLDLELGSCLFGLEADTGYLERLKNNSSTDLVLMDWWETNLDREASYEELTNSLNQLEQIQADYECLMEENERLKNSLKIQKSREELLLKDNEVTMKKSDSNKKGLFSAMILQRLFNLPSGKAK